MSSKKIIDVEKSTKIVRKTFKDIKENLDVDKLSKTDRVEIIEELKKLKALALSIKSGIETSDLKNNAA